MHNQHGYKFFFFNDTATTEIYTLSLHDALPIWLPSLRTSGSATAELTHTGPSRVLRLAIAPRICQPQDPGRSEEHTSELQSQSNLVCRLLLEKKKDINIHIP